MYDLDIDISDIVLEFSLPTNLSKAITENIVKEVGMEVHNNWIAEASSVLNSTRQGYIRGIKIVDRGRLERRIVLTGALNNMLESGAAPFDMKIGFSKSSKIVQKADGGWYLTIPFRSSTPEALGESEVFSNELPVEIYDLVKNTEVPLKNKNVPSPFDVPKSRQSVEGFGDYTPKTSIYAGVRKVVDTLPSGTTQNTYRNFRRVSNNSDTNSWIHTGIRANNFAEKAIDNTQIDIISENIVDKFLKDNGYK